MFDSKARDIEGERENERVSEKKRIVGGDEGRKRGWGKGRARKCREMQRIALIMFN